MLSSKQKEKNILNVVSHQNLSSNLNYELIPFQPEEYRNLKKVFNFVNYKARL